MRSKLNIRRPSASLVVALVALFAALGGTGYAAATLNGRDIQQRSIPGNRIVNNALGGKQVNESKLGVVPAAKRALTAEAAASATTAGSATTADSAQNAQALQGRGTEAFLANAVRVTAVGVTIRTGGSDSITVSCNANEKGIGGGAAIVVPGTDSATELDAQLTASYPVPATIGTNTMTGWRAVGLNNTGADRVLRVYAICVPKTA